MSETYDPNGLHTAAPYAMRTFTGKKVDPFTIMPADIDGVDICHALARQCRYNGHSWGHLSVARHSIHVAGWVVRHGGNEAEVLAALLHDAAEAYIGDMIRPLKARPEFEFFKQLDDTVTAVILAAFGSPFTSLPDIVHEADRQVTNAEINIMRFEYDSPAPKDKLDLYNMLTHYVHATQPREARGEAL